MQMKSKLYLRIIWLINYMKKENLIVNVEYSLVKHAASRFSCHAHTHTHTHTHTHRERERETERE